MSDGAPPRVVEPRGDVAIVDAGDLQDAEVEYCPDVIESHADGARVAPMSGGQRMLAIDERSVNTAVPTDLDAPLMTRVQKLLWRQDLAAGRATASFLPRGEASLTLWERVMGVKLPDPRVHGGVTHTAEVSMRMRKRTWQYMSSWIRCDQTLHSVWDPL